MEQENSHRGQPKQATNVPSQLPSLAAGLSNADGFSLNNSQQAPVPNHPEPNSSDPPVNGAPNNGKTPAQVSEHELYMPTANVVRIMRRALPAHAKVSDDAKEMVQQCVSEFISFVTGEANEACQNERRKTIAAEDIIMAMGRLGFDQYVEPLRMYLQKYRESEAALNGPRGGRGRGPRVAPHPAPANANGIPTFAMPMHVPVPVPAPKPMPMVPPQFGMFGSSVGGGGGSYPDGSGPSGGLMNLGQGSSAAVRDGGGPSLGLGPDMGDGPSARNADGPPSTSQTKQTKKGFRPYVPKTKK